MKLKLHIKNKGSLNSYAKEFICDLSENGLTVGRIASSLNLADSKVSGQHLHIFQMDTERIGLLDLGSRNGSYVNNEKVHRAVLKLGDEIRMGDSILTVMEIKSEMKSSGSHQDPMVIHGWPHLIEAIPQLKK